MHLHCTSIVGRVSVLDTGVPVLGTRLLASCCCHFAGTLTTWHRAIQILVNSCQVNPGTRSTSSCTVHTHHWHNGMDVILSSWSISLSQHKVQFIACLHKSRPSKTQVLRPARVWPVHTGTLYFLRNCEQLQLWSMQTRPRCLPGKYCQNFNWLPDHSSRNKSGGRVPSGRGNYILR